MQHQKTKQKNKEKSKTDIFVIILKWDNSIKNIEIKNKNEKKHLREIWKNQNKKLKFE
jgi:hypothetical protein